MRSSPARAQGQTATRLTARPAVVAGVVLRQSAVFVILLGPPCLAAMAERRGALALALAVPVLLASGVHLAGRHRPMAPDLRRIEAVLALVMLFLLACMLSAPAFVVLGLRPVDALFEAASAITTTGLSVARNPDAWPVSAHLLRAWMQWCGGLVIAIAGLALLLDPGPASHILGHADMEEAEIAVSTRTHARALLRAYLALTGIGIVGAWMLIPGNWQGPVLALAAVSTGGFAPRSDSLAAYMPLAQGFVIGLSVLGAVSLVFHLLVLRHGPLKVWRDGTGRDVARVFGLSALAYGVLHLWLSGPQGLWAGLLTALSAQSTTGFSFGPATPAPPLLLILIAMMACGGSVGSTAGGIKLDRLRLLAGIVRLVMVRLATPPRALNYLRLDGVQVPPERVLFVAALGTVYILSALILWTTFAAAGHPALPALFDSVSALSTVGLSAGVIGPDLSTPLKLLTVLAMLLGRLEFFGLIVLFLPDTWVLRR